MSMSTHEAINETRKFAQFIKAFQHLTEIADELEQAEQLVVEANARRQKIDTETQQATDDLGAIERQIIEAKAIFTASEGQAERRAKEIIEVAEQEAAAIAAASVEASDRASEDIAELAVEADKARALLKGITAEYASLSEKLAKAREDIRAFMTESD